jgi:acetyl-CoA synthetase
MDDVTTVAGERVAIADVETALVSHPAVADAVVVAVPREEPGDRIHAYVVLVAGYDDSDTLKRELVDHVRAAVGPVAGPDVIQWAPDGLPKSRSGKIMRRILRRIAEDAPGEIPTPANLADPDVVTRLAEGAKRLR